MTKISFKNRIGLKPTKLSAVIGADSFFYGLFTDDNKLLESQYYDVASFDDAVIIDKIKTDLYNIDGLEIKICSTTKPFLHTNKSDSGQLLEFFPSFKNKAIDSDVLTDQDVAVDYGVTKAQEAFVSNILGSVDHKFHISTVLSNYFYPYTKPKLIVFVEDSLVHILYANDQKFLYYNQFTCVDENDYLYFIMLALKELNIDVDSTLVELSGRIEDDSPIYKLLDNYLPNLEFMSSSILTVEDFRFRAKQHFYLDLFATTLCV